jgi:hypothetical protein
MYFYFTAALSLTSDADVQASALRLHRSSIDVFWIQGLGIQAAQRI